MSVVQFLCNGCKAKYEIPAERVRGRLLKIRCRQCGSIVEVRGDALPRPAAQEDDAVAAAAQASPLKERFKESFTSKKASASPLSYAPPAAVAAPAPAAAAASKADRLLQLAQKAESRALEMKETDSWYVAIRSKPVGPVNRHRIRGHLRKGELGPSSLVWREGFTDWKPLRACPELKELYDEAQREKPADDAIGEAIAGAAAAPEHRVAVPAAGGPGPASVAPGQKEEALRGFYVGRIEGQQTLPEAESMRPSYEAEVMPAYAPPVEVPATFVRRLLQSRLFLLGGGAVALLAGFLIMFIVMNRIEERRAARELAQAAPPMKAPPPKAPDEAPAAEEQGDLLAGLVITIEDVMASEEEPAEPGGKPAAGVKGTGKPVKGGTEKNGQPVAPGPGESLTGLEEASITKSGLGKKAAASEAESHGPAKNGLSDDKLREGVQKNQRTIQKCYEKILGQGGSVASEKIRVKVQVSVGASGIVTKVKVVEISKYGNSLGPCIEGGIKSWVFPKADAPSTFIFPILLTPKNG